MSKNKNPANSFTPVEIGLIKQLFLRLLQGGDVRVMVQTKAFLSVYKKFIGMAEKCKK